MEIGIKKKNFRNKKHFHVKKLSKLTSMKSQTDTLKDKTTDFREVNCSCYEQSANNRPISLSFKIIHFKCLP